MTIVPANVFRLPKQTTLRALYELHEYNIIQNTL